MYPNDTHVTLARDIALQSACTRRKYGAVITNGINTIATNNLRVTKVCNGGCVRDKLNLEHGQCTDIGAEVHAEQAALIKWSYPVDKNTKIVIQGFYRDETKPRDGVFLYPCHACARMLKYAGFKEVFLSLDNELVPIPVEDILAYWEG